MSFLELSVAGKTFSVSNLSLCQLCDLFAKGPPPSPFAITSRVSAEVLEAFVEAVNSKEIEITEENELNLINEYSRICQNSTLLELNRHNVITTNLLQSHVLPLD
jgi:hypothetical protein